MYGSVGCYAPVLPYMHSYAMGPGPSYGTKMAGTGTSHGGRMSICFLPSEWHICVIPSGMGVTYPRLDLKVNGY